MPRVKLSEFRAKTMLFDALGIDYFGVSVDLEDKNSVLALAGLHDKYLYVVKVDQAIKKRGHNGLIELKVPKNQLNKSVDKLAKRGFRHFLIEPFIPHAQKAEHYIALSRNSEGIELAYSPKGGVDVELHPDDIKRSMLPEDKFSRRLNTTGLDNKLAAELYKLFQTTHMTLLEINPCIVRGKSWIPLDAAVEVDSSALFFAGDKWSEVDVREVNSLKTNAERIVEELNTKSPASFSLKVLNPNGSYFLLLSGGGASVVVADELSTQSDYKLVANYGEYSGDPSQDETYVYATQIIKIMLESKASKKILIIAGGVANFTDVAKTFAGIIEAMADYAKEMKKQNLTIFVRRGGPNQEAGLKNIQEFLARIGIKNSVFGPDKSLAEAVSLIAETVNA